RRRARWLSVSCTHSRTRTRSAEGMRPLPIRQAGSARPLPPRAAPSHTPYEGEVLNHERLTIKAAEAIQSALQDGMRRGNPSLEDVHLLMALLGQDETVVVPVLQKVGVNVTRLREALGAVL